MKVFFFFILSTAMLASAATLPKVFLRGFLPSHIHGKNNENQSQKKQLKAIDGNLDVVKELLLAESNKNGSHERKEISQIFENMIRGILDDNRGIAAEKK